MSSIPVEYPASDAELARRRRAFTTLAVSLAIAAMASSLDIAASHLWVWAICVLVPVALLLLSRVGFDRSLRRLSQTVVTLTDTHLVGGDGWSSDEYALQDVARIRIKRTVKGSIREIRLTMRAGRRVHINALQDPEAFAGALLDRCGATAQCGEMKETIDFDHPLFYVVFGAAVGLAITTIPRLLATMTLADYRFVYFGLALSLLALGVYWRLNGPISGAYGKCTQVVDSIVAGGLIVAGFGVGTLALWWLR